MVRDERQSLDVITGLRQKTHFGRPEWTNIFKTIANDNPRLESLFLFLVTEGYYKRFIDIVRPFVELNRAKQRWI